MTTPAYIKPQSPLNKSKELLDFRKPDVLVPEDEQRRMRREKIPIEGSAIAVTNIGRFWATDRFNRRQTERLKALLCFCTDERMEKIIIPIISVNSRISLRALDWLVINYSKKHKIALVSRSLYVMSVYNEYRTWLHYWKRNMFDAFRRGSRIYFEHYGYTYSTTPAQLNFLYWCEKSGVLDYANNNLTEIETDMNQRISECRKEKAILKESGSKRKRCELSKAPSIKCIVYRVPVTMQFKYK
jgi:hypothetical protein